MKRNYFLLFLIIFDIYLAYTQEPVVTGDKMTLSREEYIRMIYRYEGRYIPFNDRWKAEILEIFELNVSNKNYIVVSIQYTFSIIYTIYTVDRQALLITRGVSFNPVGTEYVDLTHRIIMNNVPGIHLGNMPISIVDYNGDGLFDVLKVSIDNVIGVDVGNIHIITFDQNNNDWGWYLYDHFSYEKDSENSPINFSIENGRLVIDYVRYDGPLGDH